MGIFLYSKNTIDLPGFYQPKLIFELKQLYSSVVLLYPEFSQFDFLEKVHEQTKISEMVAEVIGPGLPWDKNQEYAIENLEFYIQLNLFDKNQKKKLYSLNP